MTMAAPRFRVSSRPDMHVLVVRGSLAEIDPGSPRALYDAFGAARRIAAGDLLARDFPKLMLPWLASHATDALDALGGDPWTYGIEPNRRTLETMLRYACADGLSATPLAVDQLFS